MQGEGRKRFPPFSFYPAEEDITAAAGEGGRRGSIRLPRYTELVHMIWGRKTASGIHHLHCPERHAMCMESFIFETGNTKDIGKTRARKKRGRKQVLLPAGCWLLPFPQPCAKADREGGSGGWLVGWHERWRIVPSPPSLPSRRKERGALQKRDGED